MNAAILHGREDLRIEEVQPRPLQPGEVRLAIEAALTCGTDLKVYKRGYHAKMIVPPAVFGHEMAGVLSEIHPDTRGWQVGERVVAANSAPCGQCFYCQHGQENLCNDLLFLNGAYAESIVVSARVVQKNLWRLKPDTAFRDAALVEPLACVVLGADELKLQRGERVLVLGAGPIGLMFVALAKHLGCAVTVAGRGKGRLHTGRLLGADRVIDVTGVADLARAIPADKENQFDAVIEAVGKPETWEAAVKLARKGGRVNFFGGCPSGTTVTLDTARIHYSSIQMLASFHHTPRTIQRALAYIESGAINAASFVDGEWPLSRLPELFRSMTTGNRAIKTLIRVRE
jgi:L-iditol 2-dehydrogenase